MLCNKSLLDWWQLYVIILASVCWQFSFDLSHINALVMEGSQIITFLAYQPLTLPPRLDPLSPHTLLPAAPGYHTLHLTLNGENPPIPSTSKQCLL